MRLELQAVSFVVWLFALSAGHCDRHDLVGKMTRFLRRLGSVLRPDGKLVLLLSADLPLLRHILR